MLQRNLLQFLRFGMVGGSGVIVNLLAVILVTKLAYYGWQAQAADPLLNLLGTRFHLRYYHLFATIAFLVANLWNYQLNRMWTFKHSITKSWVRGFGAFLLTGLAAYAVSLVVITALMNPTSPVHLPEEIFDDSSGLRNRFYWANLISIMVSMPVNFIVNKLWTFGRPRG